MKKLAYGLVIAVLVAGQLPAVAAEGPSAKAPVGPASVVLPPVVQPGKPFAVYTDDRSPGNHYVPSGFMGDHGDLRVEQDSTVSPHSGKTCIRITYTAAKTEGAEWAGIYWQQPEGNWGAKDLAFNLTGARKLVFWARGDKGGERIDKFRVGGVQGKFRDTSVSGIGPVALTPEWTRYEIDLTGKDLSFIIGGFMFVTNAKFNPQGFVMYLDDITFEPA